MIHHRLKTSFDVETMLIELQSALQVSTKAAVIRLAIGISLKKKGDPRVNHEGKIENYDIKAKDGADYNRYTIFPSDEIIYKSLFAEQMGCNIIDGDFFPDLTYAHLHRGLIELHSDYRLLRSREKVLLKYLTKKSGD